MLKTLIERQTSDNISSCVIRSKSQVRFFIGDPNINVENSFGIIGGLYDKDGSIKWSYGELLGIRASCATSEYINTISETLTGKFTDKKEELILKVLIFLVYMKLHF
mgnify:CR=1 FL=1